MLGSLTSLVILARLVALEHPSAEIPPPGALEAAGGAGLSPEALAAAGAGSGAISTMASSLAADESGAVELLSVKESVQDAAAHAIPALAHAAWAGGESGPLANATAAFDAALANVDAARLTLHDIASAGFSQDVRARLATIRPNLHRRVPASFRVLASEDSWWTSVEAALIAEARAQRTGEMLAQDAAALLAAIRADPAVVAAQAALASDLASIEAAYGQSSGPM